MKEIFYKIFTRLISVVLSIILCAVPVIAAILLCYIVYLLGALVLSPFIPSLAKPNYLPAVYAGIVIGLIADVFLFFEDRIKQLFHAGANNGFDRFVRSCKALLFALLAPLLVPFALMVVLRIIYALVLLFLTFFGLSFLISAAQIIFLVLWIGLSVVGAFFILFHSIRGAVDDIKEIYSSNNTDID